MCDLCRVLGVVASHLSRFEVGAGRLYHSVPRSVSRMGFDISTCYVIIVIPHMGFPWCIADPALLKRRSVSYEIIERDAMEYPSARKIVL